MLADDTTISVLVTGMNPVEPKALAHESVELLQLDELFESYSRYVAAIGLRLLGRDAEIDDLVQDVFLDAVRGLGTLRDPNAIRAWLATLTVRTARRKIRYNRMRRFLSGGDPADYENLVDASATPDQRLLITRCYQALEKVPANQRLAWILRHVEGEPMDVVAERCECSLASAKRYVEKANRHLQEVLGHE